MALPSIVKALESYHRDSAPAAPTTKISLRGRLKELYQRHERTMRPIADIDELTTAAKTYRNQFAHADGARLTPDDVETVFWCGQRLAFLCRAIILTELGFTQDQVLQLLQRHTTFQRLSRR